MYDDYSLLDASRLILGDPKKKLTLYRRIKRGKLSAYLKDGEYFIPYQVVQDLLGGKSSDIENHTQLWLKRLSNGYYTHKGRHYSPATVATREEGFRKFWSLQNNKSLSAVTPENLRLVLSQIDSVAYREHAYKSVLSFYKHLIHEGLRHESELEIIRKLRPAPKTNPRRTYLSLEEFEDFTNRCHDLKGKTRRDVEFMLLAVFLAAYAGLRRSEIINLKIKDLDLSKRELWVINGKGGKTEFIGIPGPLYDQINTWMKYRPESEKDNLLVMANGEPVTKTCLQLRLTRVRSKRGNRPEMNITWHGLRRTCATLLDSMGYSATHIQVHMRHSSFSMTEGAYIMDRQRRAAEAVKQWKSPDLINEKAAKPQRFFT